MNVSQKKSGQQPNREGNGEMSEFARMLWPPRPRGYISPDLPLLYVVFVIVNRVVYGALGFPAPDQPWMSAAAIILHGSALALIAFHYLHRYVGDDMGWWGPSRLQRTEVRAVPVTARVAWIIWGGIGTWLICNPGLRALLAPAQDTLGFDLWEMGTLGRIVGDMAATGAWVPLGLAAIGIVAVAPLGEELLFRRSFYQIIIEGLGGQTVAVLGSGLLFAFTHGEPFAMIRAGLAGLIFALAYRCTHSALVPVLMHAIFNFLALAAVLLDWGPWLFP